MKVLGARVLRGRVALHDRAEDPTALERFLDEPHRSGAADRQRNHRVRQHHRAAQRQNPQNVWDAQLVLVTLASHISPFELEQIDGLELAGCRANESLARLLRPTLARCLAALLTEVGDQILDLFLHLDHPASHL